MEACLEKSSKLLKGLVALPGLEPGLFALRGRRVNQLHHNAKTAYPQEDVHSRASSKYSKQQPRTQDARTRLVLQFKTKLSSSRNCPTCAVMPTMEHANRAQTNNHRSR